MRVLVVEDATAVRHLAVRILEVAGHAVRAASNPAEVVASGIDDVDVILIDVVMPGISGVDMVATLGSDVPVVYLSG